MDKREYRLLKQNHIQGLRKKMIYSEKTLSYIQAERSEEISVDMISKLIFKLHRDPKIPKGDAFLIFLPGWEDIANLYECLEAEKTAFEVRMTLIARRGTTRGTCFFF